MISPEFRPNIHDQIRVLEKLANFGFKEEPIQVPVEEVLRDIEMLEGRPADTHVLALKKAKDFAIPFAQYQFQNLTINKAKEILMSGVSYWGGLLLGEHGE